MEEPVEPEPDACCGEGCASCVWDVYREQLQKWQAVQNTTCTDNQVLSKLQFTKCTLKTVAVQTSDTAIYR